MEAVMQKQRAEVRNLNKQMLQTAAQRQQLVQEGRHHDVSVLDLRVRCTTLNLFRCYAGNSLEQEGTVSNL